MNKLGLHIIEGYSGQLGQPRLVKLVDASVAYAHQVRAEVGPNCLIIVRWFEPEQPLDSAPRPPCRVRVGCWPGWTGPDRTVR